LGYDTIGPLIALRMRIANNKNRRRCTIM